MAAPELVDIVDLGLTQHFLANDASALTQWTLTISPSGFLAGGWDDPVFELENTSTAGETITSLSIEIGDTSFAFDADGKRLAGKASTNKGEAKGLEHLHLVTYHLARGQYTDHGPIFFANRIGFPTYVNSLAVSNDGWLYALGNLSSVAPAAGIGDQPSGITDLFRVRDPLWEEGAAK